MNPILLRMESVYKHYPEKYVLDGLNFSVSRGEVIGLLGRNGAGKSTLLECALGLRPIDKGTIRLFDENPDSLSEVARAKIGYVPQKNDLFEWFTATQMLGFFKAFYPYWNDAKVRALLDRWAIPTNTLIEKLSGGEKQRLAIIRALAHEPELLILDEPAAALDPAGRRDFLREIVELTMEKQTTVVFSTHILSDVERIAASVAFLRDGRIVLQQPLDSLTERAYRLLGPASVLASRQFSGELSRNQDAAGHMSIMAHFSEHEMQQVEALRSDGVRVETVALEDLFIEVTQ